jgi:signal transduction histidine kinase
MPLLRAIVDSCSVEADARGITVDVELTHCAAVHGDVELLRRAFENVLRNAIRYGTPGTSVDLDCREGDDAVHVSIRDRGPGVPDADLSRLGEPFFRVDESRDATSGGVGLGLSIARRAIHLHHGTLVMENARPGLRVTIDIPRLQTFTHRHLQHIV